VVVVYTSVVWVHVCTCVVCGGFVKLVKIRTHWFMAHRPSTPRTHSGEARDGGDGMAIVLDTQGKQWNHRGSSASQVSLRSPVPLKSDKGLMYSQ
jgi:hypothetical protein